MLNFYLDHLSSLGTFNTQQIYYKNLKSNAMHTFIKKGFDLTAINSISRKRGVISSKTLSGIRVCLDPELASFLHFDDKIPRCVLPCASLLTYAPICCQFPIQKTTEIGDKSSVSMVGP